MGKIKLAIRAAMVVCFVLLLVATIAAAFEQCQVSYYHAMLYVNSFGFCCCHYALRGAVPNPLQYGWYWQPPSLAQFLHLPELYTATTWKILVVPWWCIWLASLIAGAIVWRVTRNRKQFRAFPVETAASSV